MKFFNFGYNYLFVFVLIVGAIYIFALKRKQILLKSFAEIHLLPRLINSFAKKQDKIKAMLVLGALILSVLALMRPQWGFVWEEVKQRGSDIFVAVDVSKSMQTKDVLPSRLQRAKLALEDLVSKLHGDRIGLIAFAGDAFVQCPLTIDYSGFLLSVKDLEPGIIPRQGTNIEQAIRKSVESFSHGSEGISRALIIITDGEIHEGDIKKAAVYAAENKITIYSIGVGTTDGELISILDETGKTSFLKDSKGQVIKSRLNEEVLKSIALETKGTYIKSTPTQFGLEVIYNNKIAAMDKKEMNSSMEKIFLERFQLSLLLALCLLVVESCITNRRKDEN